MVQASGNLDPILTAVIGNRFEAITKEIGQAMLRSSRSPIFSEARDFATAVFDKYNRLVAETAYIPILMASLPFAVASISKSFESDINEGDVFILNDPFAGNNHAPDITIIKPVYWQGELQFWSATKGHHVDVGGGGICGYNPEATSIFEECIRIAPARLYCKGEYQKDQWEMLLNNIQLGYLVEPDLHCQVGACKIGERGIRALLAKYGPEQLYKVIEELYNTTERQVISEVAAIPDGTYYAERYLDHDGVNKDAMIKIAVAIEVKGTEITFDLSRSDSQVAGYVNSTFPNTASACFVSFFTSIETEIRFNEGALRSINIVAPEGLVVNAKFPSPTVCCTISTGTAIVEAAWLALSQAIPRQVQAAWARWCAPTTIGFNPKTGRIFADIHFMCKGGGGATYGYDGWDHMGVVICSGGLRAPDPELHEMVNPYFLLQYEYWPDSSGAGQWRGGMGTVYRWRVDAPNVAAANFGGGVRKETAPFGLDGGMDAPPHQLSIVKANGEMIKVDAETFYRLDQGDIFEIYQSGGGGFGRPFARPPEKVLEDVRNGLVSLEKARKDYGVVIDPQTYQVDTESTFMLRAKLTT